MGLIEVNWKPPPRDLRIFALLFLLFAAGAGTVFFFKGSAAWLPRGLWITGGIVGVLGLLVPVAVRPVYVAMTAIALPIGMVVSTALLVLIYYGVMTPIGWVLRLTGHDPLRRGHDPAAASYWIPRPPQGDRKRYFRQF